jgi:hypothetical protein
MIFAKFRGKSKRLTYDDVFVFDNSSHGFEFRRAGIVAIRKVRDRKTIEFVSDLDRRGRQDRQDIGSLDIPVCGVSAQGWRRS